MRFGVYELDLHSGELRKSGLKIRLSGQPFQVSAMLLERPGEVVTREELQKKLWPDGTFVDFDHSLNTAINKIREVLGDSAENPRFVETLARRGYRFIAPIDRLGRTTPATVKPSLEPQERAEVIASSGSRTQRRWLIGVGTVLTVVVAMVAFRLLPPTTKAPESGLKAVPLTTYAGTERDPSLSPDGNQVAFCWNGEKQDNFDIYIKQIGTGAEAPLRLTSHPSPDFSPAWSPDGRFIGFLRELEPGKAALIVTPALGGPERVAAETHASFWRRIDPRTSYLTWSPDGKWLAVPDKSSPKEPFGLFLFSVDGSERKHLTLPPAPWFDDAGPAFSPDGRTLAFSRRDLYLLPLSADFVPAGEPKRLTFDNQMATDPVWTADGREIIFSSRQYGGRGLWRIAVSGSGKPQRLTAVGEEGDLPAISRQGSRLVYTRQMQDVNVWQVEVAGEHAKPSPPFKLISSTRTDIYPDFSPDGNKIAFQSDRSGVHEIWMCEVDGSKAAQLTSFNKGPTGTPRWSPDGSVIAFDSNAEGNFEIYVMSANGGKPKRMTTDPSSDFVPRWSRDGRWIYFCSNRSGEFQVRKMAAEGGKPVQLTQRGGIAAFESMDRTFVYYDKAPSDGKTGLWRVPVEGGNETQVLESVWMRGFSVAREGIYFVVPPDPTGHSAIDFLSFESNRTQRLLEFENPGPGLALSPDGRRLLYAKFDQAGDDLMLVENFR